MKRALFAASVLILFACTVLPGCGGSGGGAAGGGTPPAQAANTWDSAQWDTAGWGP